MCGYLDHNYLKIKNQTSHFGSVLFNYVLPELQWCQAPPCSSWDTGRVKEEYIKE